MGQGPFQYPTPDGYPDKPEAWVATLLWRWNFAFALVADDLDAAHVNLDRLAKAIGSTTARGYQPEHLLRHFLGRCGFANEIAALRQYQTMDGTVSAANLAEVVGLILASPAFQRY
jgi:hypothetical protein